MDEEASISPAALGGELLLLGSGPQLALTLGSVRRKSQSPAHHNLCQRWGQGLQNADSRATPVLQVQRLWAGGSRPASPGVHSGM